MPRPKSPEIALRNDQIYALWKGGASLRELGEQFGRAPQVIGRVIASYHPDLDDEDDRALHRGRLEDLYQEVRDVVTNPGYMMAPNGKAATDLDGRPIANLGLKVEAVRVALTVLESQRKLDGRDKPSKRVVQMEHSLAEQAAVADIAAKRAEIDRQMRVIQGHAEPVERPELPPAAEG